jgi:BirA family biotin operon repressor/biotin-[acetyl-CoA-carboxylase] ligase
MENLQIRNPFKGAGCFFEESATSTMEKAKELAAAGFPPGTVIAADYQSEGRGRLPERSWNSDPGKDLLFTIYLEKGDKFPVALPLKIGLAVARSVEIYFLQNELHLSDRPMIKWPNDILVEGRKISGILCEASGESIFIGVGINCNRVSFPPGLAAGASSLKLLAQEEKASALLPGRRGGNEDVEIDRFRFLEIFLDLLETGMHEAEWRAEVEARLFMRNRRVKFLRGHPDSKDILEGVLSGIGEEGQILIHGRGMGEAEALVSGELIL